MPITEPHFCRVFAVFLAVPQGMTDYSPGSIPILIVPIGGEIADSME
jgi:hypothetical protein